MTRNQNTELWRIALKNNPNNTDKQPDQKEATVEPESWLATEKITIQTDAEGARPLRRDFPGPRSADVALRVAVERRANAELVAHAKESLEVEVCGVLIGQTCEDAEGIFVHIAAIIRGDAASETSTHVTFTQNTWNTIHKTLERDYPQLKIVGWYHTHPGFGVEFSEMDLFIQKNFFPGPAQIALVTDPLTGAVAICINTPQGIRYLPKYWLDGREHPCRVPVRSKDTSEKGKASSNSSDATSDDISRLETRLSQLIQTVDQQRAWQHNYMLFCGAVFCIAVLCGIGYFIFRTYASQLEPPRIQSAFSIPIQVGDKTVMLGVGVLEWKVPDELNAILVEEDMLKKEAAEKAAKEAALKQEKENRNSTNVDSVTTNTDSRAIKSPTTK
jgi:proteasome lid subunit RPN8/RPN11